MRTLLLAAVSVPLALRVLSPTHGAEALYMGTWKLAVATAAPWAGRELPPDDAEKARLIGTSIVLKAREIAGPKPFACRGPKYKVSDFTADLLFQGGFEENGPRTNLSVPRSSRHRSALRAANSGRSKPAARSTFTSSTTPPRTSRSRTAFTRSRSSKRFFMRQEDELECR